ncbi:hypothetical protein CCAX7_008860 [Capsulimonas corticalis]|uniref:Uncharacterized protein n=1 Tax=Capsulimonas corticalis TaxID=2219043 RepID=A0A402CU36_9BACT|nr:hypothetical protein [Capsulimonas corticalis]BDI28835.1 hypothetical protein CCAX7_008860 [Capsulimonas corticalis]
MNAKLSSKALTGIGVLAVGVLVGLVLYFLKGSDPAAQAPIPYQKVDYAAHMREMSQSQNRPAAMGDMPPGTVVGETKP